MNEDELERTLRDAFAAEARAAVGDAAAPPPPRFAGRAEDRRHRRRVRLLAPLAAAAAVVAVVGGVVALSGPSGDKDSRPLAGGSSGPGQASASRPLPTSSAPAPARAGVHIKLLNDDGYTYGVGMPVIAYFSKRITDGQALQHATRATVNGKPVDGAWYFEKSAAGKGPVEGHFRLQSYWPAHAKVHVAIPAKGLSAGTGLAYDDNLTLDFTTGARNISMVNDADHTMTVTSDGAPKYKFPVSLGASKTPTAHGIKVIMEKGLDTCMAGPGYHECHVKYTQRLTYGGEYLHAAPWNTYNIAHGIDSSNGCTNLYINDAKILYGFLRIGDVVEYPDVRGPQMTLGLGYGDWDVPWAVWRKGGLIPA